MKLIVAPISFGLYTGIKRGEIIVYCRYCGKEVKSDWSVCPKCGNSLVHRRERKTKTVLFIIYGLLILLVAITFVLAFFYPPIYKYAYCYNDASWLISTDNIDALFEGLMIKSEDDGSLTIIDPKNEESFCIDSDTLDSYGDLEFFDCSANSEYVTLTAFSEGFEITLFFKRAGIVDRFRALTAFYGDS